MRLLLVEDSQDTARLIAEFLNSTGYDVDWAASAEAARLSLDEDSYAAVLLDLGLPDDDGLGVVRAIRAHDRHTPVIVITGRAGVDDRVTALRAGANDYIVKPVELEELAARLDGLVARPVDRTADRIRIGRLSFDPADRHLECAGKVLMLPARERVLAELLLRRAGRVVRREALERQLYGIGSEHGSNVLDVLIHRLRRRLTEAGAGVAVRTLRGAGHVLVAVDEPGLHT